MSKRVSPMRKKFCNLVKAIGVKYQMPINQVYQRIYDRVRELSGVNLYAEAKIQNKKPLDVAESRELFGQMIDIANNIGFGKSSLTGHRIYVKPAPLFEEIPDNIDPETGEILD